MPFGTYMTPNLVIGAAAVQLTEPLVEDWLAANMKSFITREPAQDATSDSAEAMAARALAMAAAGITTARDLGGPDFAPLALRDRIARGESVGPRLLCAGQPLTSPRGHCWYWGGEARGPDELRAVVRR